MYIRTDYEISLCPAIRLAGGRSAENGPNLRQIQVATTSNRLYVIYYELITTLSRLLSETLVMLTIKKSIPRPAGPAPPPPPHQPSPFGSASATSPSAGSDPLGARASRPHLVPAEACSRAGSWPIAQTWPSTILAAGSVRRLAGAELQCDAPPCWREQHRARAPFPVDPSGGDDRGCVRICAGGTPALPGGLHPMRSFHRGHDIAEAFGRRLWWKEVHPYSGLFVLIRVDSWFVFINDQPFSWNDPPAKPGARLAGKREFPKGCRSAF